MSPIIHQLIIPPEFTQQRLDYALSQLLQQYSRSRIQNWIMHGHVTIDEKKVRNRDKVLAGQIIHINAPSEQAITWQAQNIIELTILYEDNDVLVINKPVGLVVHPGAGNPENTLVNALLHHCPTLEQIPRAGIVHRLDKDTSGLLVVAKTLPAHHHLVDQLQQHTVQRTYQCVVYGTLITGGTINEPIGRHPQHRTKMSIIPNGKPALTRYRVTQHFKHFTHLKVNLATGRTHQIRVHMAHIRHPLVGDATYGIRLRLPPQCDPQLAECLRQFKRQALHAWQLSFLHPNFLQEMTFEAPLPDDMQHLLDCLRHDKR